VENLGERTSERISNGLKSVSNRVSSGVPESLPSPTFTVLPAPTTTKKCSKCGQTKPLSDFHSDQGTKDGRFAHCKACSCAYTRKWRLQHPQARRTEHLKKSFGLTVKAYDILFAAQNGACAVCQRAPCGTRLAVDHNHSTNKIRGLLCLACNTAIGSLNEDTARLARAIDYLNRYGNK
jgi:hypothetical protein